MIAMTYDYAGHQVLFRQAKARATAARRFATEADQDQAQGGSGSERRQRERDAVTTTLVLAQAAAESYANWVHIQAETTVEPRDSWIKRWEMLSEAVAKLGRRDEFALSEDHKNFLTELGAWRNYFLHADARARDRLRQLLTANGSLTEGQSEQELLTAELAKRVLRKADELFRWAEHKTGIQAPFLDAAWVAPDEC